MAVLLALTHQYVAADGFVFLDVAGSSRDELRQVDARADGRIYLVADDIDSFVRVASLDVANADPGDPAPRLTSFDFPGYTQILARPDGSVLTLGDDGNGDDRVVARSAAGATLFASEPVGNGRQLSANAMALQQDGKVVVGGSRNTAGGLSIFPEEWTLVRLNTDGSIDTSLAGGRAFGDFGPLSDDYITHLAVGPDGRIVGNGRRLGAESSTFLGRFSSAGVLDPGFGANSVVTLARRSGDVRVDADGRIYVLAGDRLVTRIIDNGVLDAAYGGGVPRQSLNISGLELDSQNRAVIFGWEATTDGFRGRIIRLTTDGELDGSFGTAGEIDVVFPRAIANPSAGAPCYGSVQTDDKPVIACVVDGVADAGAFAGSDLGVARFNADDGQRDTSFGEMPDSDVYPDAFSFTPVTVPYGTVEVRSNPVTITGINAPVRISGEFSIGCTGLFANTPGLIEAGQSVCVRTQASAQPGGIVTTSLSVGGRTATFTVTSSNEPADSIPDAFAFSDQTGVEPNSSVVSDRIWLRGLTGFATSTVANGEQSLNCEPTGFTTQPITVREGHSICVRHTSSTEFSTTANTTLSINGVSDVFTSTTRAAPPPPPPPPPAQNPPPSNGASGGGSGGGGALDIVFALLVAGCGALAVQRRRPRGSQPRG